MNDAQMEVVTQNAFKFPMMATSIEPHIGRLMVKNVLKGEKRKEAVKSRGKTNNTEAQALRRNDIVNVVRKLGNPTTSQINDVVRRSVYAVRKDLVVLCDDGTLDRKRIMLKGNTGGYVYWMNTKGKAK